MDTLSTVLAIIGGFIAVLTFLYKIVKSNVEIKEEVKYIRVGQDKMLCKQEEIEKKLDDHEIRITKLESK